MPDSVKDDLDALGEGFSKAEGQMGVAEFMSSTEFTTANEHRHQVPHRRVLEGRQLIADDHGRATPRSTRGRR